MLTIEEQQLPRFFLQEPFVNELLHICSLPLHRTLQPKLPFRQGARSRVTFRKITPLSPPLRSLQRRPQAPHAKSKFLAAGAFDYLAGSVIIRSIAASMMGR
jgi:hypothetical protein